MKMVVSFEIDDINKMRTDNGMKKAKKIDDVDLIDIYMQLNSSIINKGLAFESVLTIKYDFIDNQILVIYLS